MWVNDRWGKESLHLSNKEEDVSNTQLNIEWELGWGFWLCDLSSWYLWDITQEGFAIRCSQSAKMKRDVSFFLQVLDQSSTFKTSSNSIAQNWPGVAFAERWITLFCSRARFLWHCCWVLCGITIVCSQGSTRENWINSEWVSLILKENQGSEQGTNS